MRLIDATKAEERIVALYRKEQGAFADVFNTAIDACQNIILDMYDNESVEQKTGKWIESEQRDRTICSACGYWQDLKAKFLFSFCPNCGSLMRGGYTNENISDS